MALVWLYAYQVPLALLPFAVYSVFHVATYTRTNLIPTISPAPAAAGAAAGKNGTQQSSALANSIGQFVKQYYDASMTLVAGLEIGLWFRLLLSAISFQRGTWVLLLIYTVFFRSRYSQSAFVQGAFHGFAARIDALIVNQGNQPQVRQAWESLKNLVRQATEATDLRKYTGAQPVKKAQ
jgi:transmembrane protein 33